MIQKNTGDIAFTKDDIIIADGSNQRRQLELHLQAGPKENEIKIGHGLHSCTTEVSVYYFWHQGVRIWLVDTPGFDDTERSDLDILRDVAFWLASVYTKEARLAGIIYLHRISDGVRISERVGRGREMELIDTEGFWGGMIEMIGRGSEVMRHDGSTESAMDIVLKTVKRKLRVVLDIQTQLVDEKRSLDDTDAAQALEAELTRERKRFQEKLDQVQSDMKSALEDHDKEWQQQFEKDKKLYEDKIKKTHAETAALKTNLEKIVKEKEAQFKRLEEEMEGQQRKYDQEISRAQSSIQEIQRKHEETKTAHVESLSSFGLRTRTR